MGCPGNCGPEQALKTPDSLEKCPQIASWALVPQTPPSGKVKLLLRPTAHYRQGRCAQPRPPQPTSAATARILGLGQMPRVGGNPQRQPYSSPPGGAASLGVASPSCLRWTATGARPASEPKPTNAKAPSARGPTRSLILLSVPLICSPEPHPKVGATRAPQLVRHMLALTQSGLTKLL